MWFLYLLAQEPEMLGYKAVVAARAKKRKVPSLAETPSEETEEVQPLKRNQSRTPALVVSHEATPLSMFVSSPTAPITVAIDASL